MDSKIIIGAASSTISSIELCSNAVRELRKRYPSYAPQRFVQLPLVDGGSGSVEVLTTATLGSFLEVEAHTAKFEEAIIPIGFLGPENTTAIIESGSAAEGRRGSSYGLGELIQAAVTEGAKELILGLEAPLVRDAGIGMAAALGFRFFDGADKLMDFQRKSSERLGDIVRVEPGSRPFDLLFLKTVGAASWQRKRSRQLSVEDEVYDTELLRLSAILERDIGVRPIITNLDPSFGGLDFGIQAFLKADTRAGSDVIFESLQIEQTLAAAQELVVIVDRWEEITGPEIRPALVGLLQHASRAGLRPTVTPVAIPKRGQRAKAEKILSDFGASIFMLQSQPLPFQLSAKTSEENRREKLGQLAAIFAAIELLPNAMIERANVESN